MYYGLNRAESDALSGSINGQQVEIPGDLAASLRYEWPDDETREEFLDLLFSGTDEPL